MKRFLFLPLILIVSLSAAAHDKQAVGSFHAIEGYQHKDITVQVSADPAGSILLDTSVFPYILTQGERDALIQLVQKAVHYSQVAKENSTTVVMEKDVGSISTEESAVVDVRFITRGWENSSVEIRFEKPDQNTILSLSASDANDMARTLSAAVNMSTNLQKQLAQFN